MNTLLAMAALLLYIGVAVVVVCLAWFTAYRYGRRTMREDLATQVESYRLAETVTKLSTVQYLDGVDDALRVIRGEHPNARMARFYASDLDDGSAT